MGILGFRRERAENTKRLLSLHGKAIRYVTRRVGEDDTVLGHGGVITVHVGEIIVLSSGQTVFRSVIRETKAAFLMSGDGVILTAPNIEYGGQPDEITAHFVDYIK